MPGDETTGPLATPPESAAARRPGAPAARDRSRLYAVLAGVLTLVLVGMGVAAATLPGRDSGVQLASPVVSETPTPTPSPTATPTPTPTPSPSATPAAAPPVTQIAEVQRRLAELRYYVGAIDGAGGPATRSALMAFQKVNDLGADGVLGPQTLAALAAPKAPALRGGEADRIEIDLTRQVLYLVKGGQLSRILPVSSGSGDTYTTSGGGTATSLTPVGTFRIERRIRGVREAALGTLYDPLYFYRGWAIHGSNSVPAYPASHGCVRVTRADATWLFDRAPNGTQVILHGGTHVFAQGSNAAGTDAPAGDTPQDAAPQPTPPVLPPSPEPEPVPQPTPADPVPPPPAPSEPVPTPSPTAPPA